MSSMSIENHPGYLGWTSEGVIAIHADWPAYAIEHGWRYALMTLGQFPPETVFRGIDDIDECFLFFVGNPDNVEDEFDERHFHVALWHRDAFELFDRGYVSGASGMTPRQWAERRATELAELMAGLTWQQPNGSDAPVPTPTAEDFEDDEAFGGLISRVGLTITKQGLSALQGVLLEEKELISGDILKRTRGLMLLQQHDTAVREACLLAENLMRKITGSHGYGAQLIESFFAQLSKSGRFIPAQLKVLRTEVRAAFKFIRNEYMHNLHDISQEQCYAILVRMSAIYERLREIEVMLGG
jgi:hypothetical protein